MVFSNAVVTQFKILVVGIKATSKPCYGFGPLVQIRGWNTQNGNGTNGDTNYKRCIEFSADLTRPDSIRQSESYLFWRLALIFISIQNSDIDFFS